MQSKWPGGPIGGPPHLCISSVAEWNPLPKSDAVKNQTRLSLFYLTKAAVKSQEHLWHANFSDDEIALIATYFGGAIVQQTEELQQRQILVVCSSGIGTSQFLLLQLRNRYPQVHFTGPLSTAECLQFPLDDVSLVITTTSRQYF